MKSRLLNISTVVSALLCLAILQLWHAANARARAFGFHYHDGFWQIVCEDGRLRLDNRMQRQMDARELDVQRARVARLQRLYLASMLDGRTDGGAANIPQAAEGVQASRAYTAGIRQLKSMLATHSTPPVEHSVHLAFLLATTLILPATWLLLIARTRRRARSGRCVACGYDLRASPTRCPECGLNATPP